MLKNRHTRGFTLIELLVVIAVIGLLASVVLASLNSARTKAKNASRIAAIDQIEKAFQLGITGNTNQLPSSNNGSAATYACLGDTACWGGPPVPFNNLLVVDAVVNAGISGGKVPTEPFKQIVTGPAGSVGSADTALYHSYLWPGGGGNPATPLGAYLLWAAEIGTVSSSPCGRGVVGNIPPPGTPYFCLLYIGQPVP